MRVYNTQWTYADTKLLKAAWVRRTEQRVPTEVLAKELGINGPALITQWRKRGMFPMLALKKERSTENRDRRVHVLRGLDLTYKECCTALQIEPSYKNARTLAATHKRYCTRIGIPFPKGKHLRGNGPEYYKKLLKWRRERKSYAQMCDLLGIPRYKQKTLSSNLSYYCKKHGIEWPIKLGEIPEIKKKKTENWNIDYGKVQAWRLEKKTYKECCVLLGLDTTESNMNILGKRHARYCELNNLTYPKPMLHREDVELYEKMIEWKQQGKTYVQMCDILGRPREHRKRLGIYLMRYCKKHGLEWPIKPKGKDSGKE